MDLGLDSLLAMGIAATLQSRLRLEPGTTEGGPALDQETILALILQEPTPRAASLRLCGLANAAAAEPSFEAPPWLRGLSQLDLTRLAHRGMLRGPLRPSGRVAYYLPGAPGVCLVEFALLAARLSNATLVGLPYTDLVESLGAEASVQAVAVCLADRILGAQGGGGAPAERPLLLGFSFGALLCREVGGELAARGAPPAATVLLDPLPCGNLPRWLGWASEPLAGAATDALLSEMRAAAPHDVAAQLDRLAPAFRSLLRAGSRYAHRASARREAVGPVLLLRARESIRHPMGVAAPGGLFASAVRCALAPSPSYQAQCGAGSAPHEVVVEGSHFTFLQQPALAASAAAHIASFLNSIAARDDLPSGGADGGPAPIVDGQASLGHGACAAACA